MSVGTHGSVRVRVFVFIAGVALVVTAAVLGVYAVRDRIHVGIETEWAIGIYSGKSMNSLGPVPGRSNPVIRAADVTDVRATFVADPFMVRHEGLWYMFFEVMSATSGHGEIGLAMSPDALTWSYSGLVLDEPFHLSFPYVFEWRGAFYMVPECATAGEVRLYRAVDFPARWECVRVLARGRLADSGLLRHNGAWWLFTCGAPQTHDTLRLFVADRLMGPYREHPRSPLIAGDGHRARLGGRLITIDGQPVRFAQDCWPTYGKEVRAFVMDIGDMHDFAERPLQPASVVRASGKGWNRHGMHHVDPHLLETGTWIACVDGYRKHVTVRFEY